MEGDLTEEQLRERQKRFERDEKLFFVMIALGLVGIGFILGLIATAWR